MRRRQSKRTDAPGSLLLACAWLVLSLCGGCSPALTAPQEGVSQTNLDSATRSDQNVGPDKDPAQKVRRFLRRIDLPRLRRASPRFQIPFLRGATTGRQFLAAGGEIAVRRSAVRPSAAAPPPAPAPLRSEAFFTEDGDFFGAQSVQTFDDPIRRSVEEVEISLRNITHAITGAAKVPDDFDYDAFWQVMARRVDLTDVKEFTLYVVNYDFGDGGPRPVIVLNIWGPRNPLGMREELPAYIKNRIRLIYDLREKTWAADNIL